MNVSELGLVTPAGKVVWGNDFLPCFVVLNSSHWDSSLIFIWDEAYYVMMQIIDIIFVVVSSGKYAQVTNNPENDGCINAVLLV